MTSKLTKKIKALAERAKTSLKLRRLKLARRSYSARRNVSRRLGLRKKPFGVNLVAYVRAELGLGEAARGMAAALEAAGVPFGIINYDFGLVSPKTDGSWQHKEVLESYFAVTVLCINPDNTTNLRVQLPQHLLSSRYVIGNWFWEMPEIPDAWTADFEILNEVWAGSRFVQKAVEKRSPVPVVWIPPAVNVRVNEMLPRADFGLLEKCFLFLT